MPVTSFAILLVAILVAAAATVWALSAWGLLTVLPILMAVALIARWALAHVPYDEPNP